MTDTLDIFNQQTRKTLLSSFQADYITSLTINIESAYNKKFDHYIKFYLKHINNGYYTNVTISGMNISFTIFSKTLKECKNKAAEVLWDILWSLEEGSELEEILDNDSRLYSWIYKKSNDVFCSDVVIPSVQLTPPKEVVTMNDLLAGKGELRDRTVSKGK